MKIVLVLELLPFIFFVISGFSIILSANSIIPNITQRDYVLSFLIFGIVYASIASYGVIKETINP